MTKRGLPTDLTKSEYSHVISREGGIPVLLPNIEKPDEKLFCEIAHNIDGLLLSGGGDISPEYYGKKLSSYEKDVIPCRNFV